MSNKKVIQKAIIIISILAFVGSTGLMAASFFTGSNSTPQATANQTEAAREQLLTAEEGYEDVLAREPENQFALQQLITVRLELGKIQEALQPLEKFVELNPENQEALQALAAVRLRTGDADGAIASLEKIVALNPDKPELKEQLEQLKEQVAELKKGNQNSETNQPQK
ncbi:MAG: tetratricopeptide repeat protein [Cyanobacteriota bacterium]|nr:tetratricopeptide repeat protein [Cyanobacteriota bacterium]